jgi:hypothetical protein
LSQLHTIVKNGQLYLEKLRTNDDNVQTSYIQEQTTYEERNDYMSANYPM